MRHFLWAALIVVATPVVTRAADEQWQIGTTPSFSSGKYGTNTSTEVFYTPLMARRLFTNGDLTFVFPFTCINGGSVTIVNGSPVPTDTTSGSRTSAGTTSTRTGTTAGRTGSVSGTSGTPTDATLPSGTGSPSGTNCGLGDIVVRGRYYLLDEHGWLPTIAVRTHVKAPTADAESGLGTGRIDQGVGIEVSRTLGAGAMLMGDGGYTIIGQPAGVEFNNNWWYDIGIGQDMARGVVNLSVFFEEYRAIVPGYANARDVLAAVTIKGGNWRLQVSGEFGLSDGAADHGFTFGASRRF